MSAVTAGELDWTKITADLQQAILESAEILGARELAGMLARALADIWLDRLDSRSCALGWWCLIGIVGERDRCPAVLRRIMEPVYRAEERESEEARKRGRDYFGRRKDDERKGS